MAAAWIRVKHGVAAAGQHLELVEERVPVRAVGPPVDLQDERPGLRRVEAARLQQPALDGPAVGAGEVHALGLGDVPPTQQLAVQVGDRAHAAAGLPGHDLAR